MSKNASLVSIGTATLAFFATSAPAATVSLYDAVGDPKSTSVKAGESFTVTVRLTADQSFVGYSLFLTDPGFTADTRFTLRDRASLTAGNPFTDSSTADAAFDADPIDDMTQDLGYTSADAADAGVYDLMSLSISSDLTLTPGDYTILFHAFSGLTTASFDDETLVDSSGYTINITPVPEPSSFAAVMAATLCLVGRRRPSRGRGA
jgi:hypothetical protein